MTVKAALLFLEELHATPLSDRTNDPLNDLAAVVDVGHKAGFDFTVEELRIAYKQAWGLRWLKRHSQLDKGE